MKLWTKITWFDIYDYFKESTTDGVEDALAELGDEFTGRRSPFGSYQVLLWNGELIV